MLDYGLLVTRRPWRAPQEEKNPLAKGLAAFNARFTWMQRSKDESINWVDDQRRARYDVNPYLHEHILSRPFETVVPKQWDANYLRQVCEGDRIRGAIDWRAHIVHFQKDRL